MVEPGLRSLAMRRRYLRRRRLERLAAAVLPYTVSAIAFLFVVAVIAGWLP